MNTIHEYIHSKGYTVAECQKPAVLPKFPCEIHGRRFETQEEYLDALHDFLNGN